MGRTATGGPAGTPLGRCHVELRQQKFQSAGYVEIDVMRAAATVPLGDLYQLGASVQQTG